MIMTEVELQKIHRDLQDVVAALKDMTVQLSAAAAAPKPPSAPTPIEERDDVNETTERVHRRGVAGKRRGRNER
jgi:hypothetical protein